ncbi:MAG: 6-phosphogluconolactonase [Lishizhenia sp.]
MENELIILNSKEEFTKKTTQEISFILDNSLKKHNQANLLLSGGSTPGPVYKKLSKTYSSLDKVNIGLVDERYVAQTSEYSNELLLKNCFGEKANISGMVYDLEKEENNIDLLNTAYGQFIERTDLLILGMGGDGHIASIFPEDEGSNLAIKDDRPFLFTKAPSNPKIRITSSFNFILNSKNIFLFITGDAKLNILQNNTLELPIHKLLKNERNKNIKIFYTK